MADIPAQEQIRLVIVEARDCDCYMPGEQVVFNYPEVLKRESDRICASFIRAVAPLIEAFMRNEEPVGYSSTGNGIYLVRCIGRQCKITVRVDRNVSGSSTIRLVSKSSQQLLDEISTLPMFRRMESELIYEVAGRSTLAVFEDGQTLVKAGERGTHLFIVLRGTASVMGMHEDGTEHSLALLARGDVIGEMSLITGSPVSANVVAQGQCTVAKLIKLDYFNLMSRFPSLALYFAKLLAERLKSSNQQFISLLEQGVAGKLSIVSLPELCQIIRMNARSGILKFTHRRKLGRLYFHEGSLVAAESGMKIGEDAFYDLIEWEDGEFMFEDTPFEVEQTINCDVMALILEAMRRRDESKR